MFYIVPSQNAYKEINGIIKTNFKVPLSVVKLFMIGLIKTPKRKLFNKAS
jgi:hypothetical protein